MSTGDRHPGSEHEPEPDLLELQRRVVYALFLPAVRLAFSFGLPIRELVEWLEMAYFHETRRRGLVMREASERLGVSVRKVAMLASQLKQNFAQPDREVELPRRIEFLLWAEPLSEARIKQLLSDHAADEIREALDQLVAEGRATEQPGRVTKYAVVKSEFRLVNQRGWLSRIDGLNNLLGSVTNAVYGRFFHAEPRAFARTLSLRVRPADRPRLQQLYEEAIWETLRRLDAEAKDDPEAQQVDVSIVWAPYDYVLRTDNPEVEEDER